MTGIRIVRIARLDLRVVKRPWAFAQERREEIDSHFRRLQETKPLWNGRVLLMCEHAVDGDALRGACLETDFASFVAWRDWGFPDKTMRNCFAPAALQGSDGAYVLGVMSQQTANAGQIYFPCGTPDPDDVCDGRVDLDSSARRELLEETGIAADELDVDAGWHAVFAGPRIAMMKAMRSHETADVLQKRIRSHIARESKPELADVHLARGPADVSRAVPDFTAAYLADRWNNLAKHPQRRLNCCHETRKAR
jgi:8-oxo-dGTP pyrophosphatase MutT (NUDIX family)